MGNNPRRSQASGRNGRNFWKNLQMAAELCKCKTFFENLKFPNLFLFTQNER